MSNRARNKELERRYVEVFKREFKDFPNGEIIADENQERPDIVLVNAQNKIGIEVTRLIQSSLKQEESECDKMIFEARRIYEKCGLPNLHLSVHSHTKNVFNRNNRTAFAEKLANLIAANVPVANGYCDLRNDWSDSKNFPEVIDSVLIFRPAKLSENIWTVGSWGWIQENFTQTLQDNITKKEIPRSGYDTGCNAHWLLIVAEHNNASSFFDPSQSTLYYNYSSSFDRVFFLELFNARVFELKINKSQSV